MTCLLNKLEPFYNLASHRFDLHKACGTWHSFVPSKPAQVTFRDNQVESQSQSTTCLSFATEGLILSRESHSEICCFAQK